MATLECRKIVVRSEISSGCGRKTGAAGEWRAGGDHRDQNREDRQLRFIWLFCQVSAISDYDKSRSEYPCF